MSKESLLHHLQQKHKFATTDWDWPSYDCDGSFLGRRSIKEWMRTHRHFHRYKNLAKPHSHDWMRL